MYIKILAGTMILTGCLGLGLWYRRQYRERIRYLQGLDQVLEGMSREIAYGRNSLPECSMALAHRLKEPWQSLLLRVEEAWKAGMNYDFSEVFSETVRRELKNSPLTGSDIEVFLEFLPVEGCFDEEMQRGRIERSRDGLGRILNGLRKEEEPKSRMSVTLGLMSGLLLILILS